MPIIELIRRGGGAWLRLGVSARALVIEGKSYRMDSFVRRSRELSPPESPIRTADDPLAQPRPLQGSRRRPPGRPVISRL